MAFVRYPRKNPEKIAPPKSKAKKLVPIEELERIRLERPLTAKECYDWFEQRPYTLGWVPKAIAEDSAKQVSAGKFTIAERSGLLIIVAMYNRNLLMNIGADGKVGVCSQLTQRYIGKNYRYVRARYFDVYDDYVTGSGKGKTNTHRLMPKWFTSGEIVPISPYEITIRSYRALLNNHLEKALSNKQPTWDRISEEDMEHATLQLTLETFSSCHWQAFMRERFTEEGLRKAAVAHVDAKIKSGEYKRDERPFRIYEAMVAAYYPIFGYWEEQGVTEDALVQDFGLVKHTRCYTPQNSFPKWAEKLMLDEVIYRIDLSQEHVCVLAKLSEDPQLIQDLTDGVDIYEKINPDPAKYSRSAVKVQLQTIFNDTKTYGRARTSKYSTQGVNKTGQRFAAEYPTAWKWLIDVKHKYSQGMHHFGNHYETLIKEHAYNVLGFEFLQDIKHEHDGYASTSAWKLNRLASVLEDAAKALGMPYLRVTKEVCYPHGVEPEEDDHILFDQAEPSPSFPLETGITPVPGHLFDRMPEKLQGKAFPKDVEPPPAPTQPKGDQPTQTKDAQEEQPTQDKNAQEDTQPTQQKEPIHVEAPESPHNEPTLDPLPTQLPPLKSPLERERRPAVRTLRPLLVRNH